MQSQVTFNRIPEKVSQKVPEKVWEASVQSQVTLNRVLEKVPEKVWEALVQSQVRFNRVPEKVPALVQRLGSTGFWRRFGRSFWRRFRRRSARLWCRARSGSTGFAAV